ncbi:MAG TPA: 3,4-dehydroadipyl-CoA semialdehyde dehydrogenase [Thermoanaerobaculia bacterium]|nr:3,4-dehydroadipyl-CoA semialdehyde dehydrogenase [Thermoanaerobaculia bacterium]
MQSLSSYLEGRWIEGAGPAAVLVNPSTEEPVAEIHAVASLGAAVAFARDRGGPALRALSFAERGQLLLGLSKLIHQSRDELIDCALRNGGNTRQDAKFDIDGAIGALVHYAELGAKLGTARVLADGEPDQVGRSPRLVGRHLQVPRMGVAVFVNAFNFPAWGFAEKAACALLAGMPVITKPATATALVAHRIFERIAEKQALPEATFQLLLGPVGDLFDHLDGQDVLAFTGSSGTGAKLKGDPRLVARNVRINLEADSLNAAVLGADAGPTSSTFKMMIADVARDMTQKTGQKCTAIRRVMVPEDRLADVRDALSERLETVIVGNPASEQVTMGPLATREQLGDVRAGAGRLAAESKSVFGGDGAVEPVGAPAGKGFFFGPVVFEYPSGSSSSLVHDLEVFGPVATLVPYDGSAAAAAASVRRGQGGLVSSVYSDDRDLLTEMIAGIAPFHGRVFLGSEKIADKSAGPGTVPPQLVHGGPGRAGAGEELGGVRGMALYLQRVALQGDRAVLDAITSKL